VTLPGVLLTGGSSRRMGRDKATMVVNGEQLAQRAARVLAAVCEPVVEVGRGVTDLRFVRESPAGAGPLAALVAGADALGADAVLLLACDYPFVDTPVLRLIAEWPGMPTAIPVAGDRSQYACARYGSQSLAQAAAGLRTARVSLRVAADVDHDVIPESVWTTVAPANTFCDVDTPDDLRDLGLS
jgi:molybdopterin-guanine dinucleotide biosynthesis protein A